MQLLQSILIRHKTEQLLQQAPGKVEKLVVSKLRVETY